MHQLTLLLGALCAITHSKCKQAGLPVAINPKLPPRCAGNHAGNQATGKSHSQPRHPQPMAGSSGAQEQ